MKTIISLLFTFSSLCLAQSRLDGMWEPIGPYEGYVQAVAINSTGDIFATVDSGVFRSTDNGTNWTRLKIGLQPYTSIVSLTTNPGGDIFAAWLSEDIQTGGGIYRSTDNGESWVGILSTGSYNKVTALVINSNGHIFAGLYVGGVLRSEDNGVNWTEINYNSLPAVSSLVINSSGNIFAGTSSGGVFCSIDNGENWAQMNTGLTNLNVSCLAINSSDHIFAGTWEGVFRSIDNGDSWTFLSDSPGSNGSHSFSFNSNNYIFAGTDSGIFQSTNNGDSWEEINKGLPEFTPRVNSIEVNLNGFIFAGTAAGVYRNINFTTAIGEKKINTFSTYALEQNYPNPFNPSTKISYSIPQKSFVTLKIFNALGEEISQLVNEEKESGRYEIDFNASELSSGVYLYRIEAGSFVQTKKMILLR